MAKRFKSTTHTGTVGGALEGAASDVRELHDEMEEWASNMEGNNMEHLPKYDEVSEAKDALEQIADTLEGVDVPQSVADISVTYRESRPYGRKPMSRSMRLGNAEDMFEAAKAAIEEKITELREADEPECQCSEEGQPDEPDAKSDEHEVDCPMYKEEGDDTGTDADDPDELQSLLDELEECDFSGVNFPGMFG